MQRILTKAISLTITAGMVLWAFPMLGLASIDINGDLSDWGVTITTGNDIGGGNLYQYPASQNQTTYDGVWSGITAGTPTTVSTSSFVGGWSGSKSGSLGMLYYQIEDQNDQAKFTSAYGYGFLGPNHGAQDYDAEFLGVVVENGKMYIAIVTGQRNDNGFGSFSPGDIRIETHDGGLFGIEVGGGEGGTGVSTVALGAAGSSYTVNKSTGTTTGHTALADRKAGSVWSTASTNWDLDPIPPPSPSQINGGTYLGMADGYVFKQIGSGTGAVHSVIEVAIDLSLLGTSWVKSVQWTMGCGNDGLAVSVPVPEPTTLGIWGLGCVCVLLYSRSRMRKRV